MISSIKEENQHFAKWNNLLGQIDEKDRVSYNIVPFKCTNASHLQWFQYDILHHILPTNSRLYKMGYVDSDMCNYCLKDKESVVHLF